MRSPETGNDPENAQRTEYRHQNRKANGAGRVSEVTKTKTIQTIMMKTQEIQGFGPKSELMFLQEKNYRKTEK